MFKPKYSNISRDYPVVKILILGKDGVEGIFTRDDFDDLIQKQKSSVIRDLLIKLKKDLDSTQVKLQVEIINESINPKETAIKLKNIEPDIVIINEDISFSAWETIREYREQNFTDKTTNFYIDGDINNILNKEIKQSNLNGSIAITKSGKYLLHTAQGVASNHHPKKLNTVDTKFNIASITKMFTAAAIAKLAEIGKINFDDKIGKFLPNNFPNIELLENITIKQLLNHTSGLIQRQAEIIFKTGILEFNSLTNFLPILQGDIYRKDLHGNFSYSNLNYLLLGCVIEIVINPKNIKSDSASWKDYFSFIDELILQPCGMKNTHPRAKDDSFALSYVPMPKSIDNIGRLKQLENDEVDLRLNQIIKNTQASLQVIKTRFGIISDLYETLTPHNMTDFKKLIDQMFLELSKIKNDISANLLELDRYQKINTKNISELKEILSSINEDLDEASLMGFPYILYSMINCNAMAVPGGYYRSTAEDVVAFQQALWSNKIIMDTSPLTKSNFPTMSDDPHIFTHYGFGICTWGKSDDSVIGVGHDGAAPGAISTARRYQAADITLAILSNNDDGIAFSLCHQIENNLVASCFSNASVRYFDSNINPNAQESMLRDVGEIATCKVKVINDKKTYDQRY